MTNERTEKPDSSPVPELIAKAIASTGGASRVAPLRAASPVATPPGGIVAWLSLGVIVLASAGLGWAAARLRDGHPAADLVVVEASYGPAAASSDPSAAVPLSAQAANSGASASSREVGRLKAEMLRLRVLFQRLADVAELDDDGEFDIDYDIDMMTGDGEPLSALDPDDPDALALLIERFAPMVRQSERMTRIFTARRQDYDLRLSGRPLANGALSSGFGQRRDPLTGDLVMHRGLDFVGAVGEPVLALADGVVTFAGNNGGYGLLVELEHAGGFKTRYAHNDTTIAMLGAAVGKGEAIATLGSSGRSTGPHLHLEVRHRGHATDPRFYVR